MSLASIDLTLEEVEKALAAPSRRMLALAVLRAVEANGGTLDSNQAKRKVADLFGDLLTPAQKDHLRSKRIGWARQELKTRGLLVKDSPGAWILTDLGRAYLERHHSDILEAPPNIPDGVEVPSETGTETVESTDRLGFEIPLLRNLAKGGTLERSALKEAVKAECEERLLPGDRRFLPSGDEVLSNRIGWALSSLKTRGEARNPMRATWEITERGLERLEKESPSWRLENYQNSKVAVLTSAPPIPSEGLERQDHWKRLELDWGRERVRAIQDRLQTQLGATPRQGKPNRNLILYGPPGTGKTHLAKQLAQALTDDVQPGADRRWRVVQFHPSYAYEDFVQGIRPVLGSTGLNYDLRSGPLLEISSIASADPDNFYVLIVDEINRGDPARIFGEALYALEYRGENVDMAVDGTMNIPPNLVVIGTMNSVDRSVALVDYALRRRFGFVRLQPDPDLISRRNVQGALAAAILLKEFNGWLVQQLDEEHALGHSFFFGTADLGKESLERIWRSDWLPLLEEYFFNDQQRLREAALAWESSLRKALSEEAEE